MRTELDLRKQLIQAIMRAAGKADSAQGAAHSGIRAWIARARALEHSWQRDTQRVAELHAELKSPVRHRSVCESMASLSCG
jgi:hypothetical protein